MKKIIIFISLALSILSCEEIEVDIQRSEPTNFSINANVNQESLLINEKFEFNLFIEAIAPITEELGYSLKFFDTGITGELSINGIVYQEGEMIPNISPGTTVIDYIGNEVGSGAITFQVTASNDLVKSIPVPISIQKTDFDFEVLFDNNESYINEETPFNINIQKTGTESLTYKAYFKNAEGEIKFDNQDELIFQNRMFDISEGVTFGNFKGTVAQESQIEFVVEASNGVTKSQMVNYKILQTDFEFIVLFDQDQEYINDLSSMRINLQKKGIENITYQTYFTDVQGQLLLSDGRIAFQNQLFSINEGGNTAEFKGTTIQESEIVFVVEASNGVIKTQKVSFNILPTDFEVIINPTPIRGFFEFNASFEINIIKPPVSNQFIEYTMTYYTNIGKPTNLEIRDLDNPEGNNNIYDFKTRTYSSGSIELLGSAEPASGKITMIFTDSNGVEVRKTIDLEFYDN